MGGRRWGRRYRAYGVVVTFLPQKGGAVPESEKRRAACRATLPLPYVSCAPPSLSHLLISFPPRRCGGGAAGAGCGVRCAVCAIVCLASCVCTFACFY